MQKLKMQKGITLIALIITIIIMLILVGVTISVSLNGGLFTKTKKATLKTEEAHIEEMAMSAWLQAYVENKTDEELQEAVVQYLTENGVDVSKYEIVATKDGVSVLDRDINWIQEGTKVVRGEEQIEIGATVNYDSGVDGYSEQWAVIGTEDGQLLLISKSIGTLTLQGKPGYTNGINQLNTMCEAYGKGYGATGARSIKVEDVNDATGYDPYKTGDSKVFREGQTGEYGNKVTYFYKDGVIAYKTTNGLEGSEAKYTSYENFDEKIISSEYPNNTVTHTNTYYYYNINTLSGTAVNEDNVVIPVGGTIDNLVKGGYWLADTDICTSPSRTSWQVRAVLGENVNAVTLYHSFDDDDQTPHTYQVRAVVYVNSDANLEPQSNGSYNIEL